MSSPERNEFKEKLEEIEPQDEIEGLILDAIKRGKAVLCMSGVIIELEFYRERDPLQDL